MRSNLVLIYNPAPLTERNKLKFRAMWSDLLEINNFIARLLYVKVLLDEVGELALDSQLPTQILHTLRPGTQPGPQTFLGMTLYHEV